MKLLSRLFLAATLCLGAGSALAQQKSEAQQQQQQQMTQPGNNAPVWREVRGGQTQYTTSSAQGRETNILVQSAGETGRRNRNGPVTFYGG